MCVKCKNAAVITLFLFALNFLVGGGMHFCTERMPVNSLIADQKDLSLESQSIVPAERSVPQALMAAVSVIGSSIEMIQGKQGNLSFLRSIFVILLSSIIAALLIGLKSGLFAYLIERINMIDSLLYQIQIIHQMDGKKRISSLVY